jgi:transcriptional regulator of acetoin/glycerol metabolism
MRIDEDKTVRGDTTNVTPDAPADPLPTLFLVLECHRPSVGGARYALRDLDEVVFGRGADRESKRATEAGRRGLVVRTLDPMMSSTHARLVRSGRRWALEDAGSTNGTRIGGKRVQRVELDDGAVFELGTTLFMYRDATLTPRGSPAVVERAVVAPGLSTLLPAYAQALATFARVAASGVPLLLLGESGTGKEVLARAAHAVSGRSGAFVPVNCGALPETLVESQLFGHMKGAFSGAVRDEPGFVRSSDKGTLFLDEIGDLPKLSQAALLRVLQEKEVTPVGSTKPVKVDLRVVAATHRRVDASSKEGPDSFRSDLYARLAGYVHELPPLRERKEDMGLLLAALLAKVSPGAPLKLTPELARTLLAYDWPLNVRELEQCLSVAAVLARDGTIELSHLPEATRQAIAQPRAAEAPPQSDDAIREHLVAALEKHKGNISEVARAMGRTRMQIHRWMKRWEIDPQAFRK